MSKHLNNVLNNVVRELFEDGNEYGPAEYNWGDTVLPDTYKGEDGKTYYATGSDTPNVVATYSGPATVLDQLEQAGKDFGGSVKNAAGTVYNTLAGVDRGINNFMNKVDDTVIRGAIEPGVQKAGDVLSSLGQNITNAGAKGIRLLGKETGNHTIENFGAEHDPSMTWQDKAEKFLRQTGDNISDAYGKTKDAVVDAWKNATPGQKAAALGALGTTALASGAGALYLRKKQREANKAAGRK